MNDLQQAFTEGIFMSRIQEEQLNGYTLYTASVGKEQLLVTACVTENMDDKQVCESIYEKIGRIIHENGMHMVLERIFGDLSIEDQILAARQTGLERAGESAADPVTYIQGHPLMNEGLAGLQVRAVRPSAPDKIWTIQYEGEIHGQGWRRNGTSYLLIQNIHGGQADDQSRQAQTFRMFERVRAILESQGASYRHVVRTWIYLSNILDWYSLFNEVRNDRYQAYGLIQDHQLDRSRAEKIYLPASTGIEGDNAAGTSGTMDVLAVVNGPNAHAEIFPIHGLKQKSAFRYGSAFSRAIVIREPDVTQILVSGTASIDESGNSVYRGDMRSQILKTFEVVEALISTEGATLNHIAKTTVFLKNRHDLDIYLKTLDEIGLENFPAILVQADVCRPELLFELDAVAVIDG